jgi:hypothetical protein
MKFIAEIVSKGRFYNQKAREYYSRARVMLLEFVRYMKSSDSDTAYAAAGFFPFIGWLFPLYFREKSDKCQQSGKQGLVLSLLAVGFLISLFMIELIIPRSFRTFLFALIVLTYIINVAYLALSAYAIYRTANGKAVQIPWVTKQSQKLSL